MLFRSGSVRLGAPYELVLDPTAAPLSNGKYQAIATTSLKDRAGNALKSPISWTFEVVDTVRPAVVQTSPWDGEPDVAPSLQVLTVEFDEPVLASTLTPSALEVRGAGPDGVVGTFDDRVVALSAVARVGTTDQWRFSFPAPFRSGHSNGRTLTWASRWGTGVSWAWCDRQHWCPMESPISARSN